MNRFLEFVFPRFLFLLALGFTWTQAIESVPDWAGWVNLSTACVCMILVVLRLQTYFWD